MNFIQLGCFSIIEHSVYYVGFMVVISDSEQSVCNALERLATKGGHDICLKSWYLTSVCIMWDLW